MPDVGPEFRRTTLLPRKLPNGTKTQDYIVQRGALSQLADYTRINHPGKTGSSTTAKNNTLKQTLKVLEKAQ